jgi:hypothetical protein
MDYNTVRPRMIIPEYGRNIQKMVDYALSVEDREKRTKIANLIVNVMNQLSPSSRETMEARHKLWDHLYVISEYKLDVDSPFPMPDKDDYLFHAETVKYPHKDIKYKHYGNNIQLLIEKAISYEEGKQKEDLIIAIANHMKKLYLTWNRESVEDDVIAESLLEMSKGTLKLSEGVRLNETRDILLAKPKKKKFNPRPGNNNQQNKNRFKRDFKRDRPS